MSLSFQMEQAVDKQIQDENALAHAIGTRLQIGRLTADKNLAVFRSDGIRKDIRRICFSAQAFIQRAGARGGNKHERYLPAG